MARHLNTGKYGEHLAAEWLKAHGFTVMERNWRYSYYEIDIIANYNEILHFIEVKSRMNTRYGLPEESVSEKKFNNLLRAAEEYQFQHPHWKRVQYDILSIISVRSNPEYFLIQDVYM